MALHGPKKTKVAPKAYIIILVLCTNQWVLLCYEFFSLHPSVHHTCKFWLLFAPAFFLWWYQLVTKKDRRKIQQKSQIVNDWLLGNFWKTKSGLIYLKFRAIKLDLFIDCHIGRKGDDRAEWRYRYSWKKSPHSLCFEYISDWLVKPYQARGNGPFYTRKDCEVWWCQLALLFWLYRSDRWQIWRWGMRLEMRL